MTVVFQGKSCRQQEQKSIKINDGFLNRDGACVKYIAGQDDIKSHHYHKDRTPCSCLADGFCNEIGNPDNMFNYFQQDCLWPVKAFQFKCKSAEISQTQLEISKNFIPYTN